MKSGRTSSERITKMYLNRIDAINKKGPSINVVIEVNPDVAKTAAAMDSERKHRKLRSTLHGSQVLVKDNIETAENMMTNAGALDLLNHKTQNDPFIVK